MMDQERSVHVKSCMPVIPSADLEKSLRFWYPRTESSPGKARLRRVRDH